MRRISLVAIGLLAFGCAHTPATDVSPLLHEILALDSPEYTGGLTLQHRNLAERIRASLADRFKGTCDEPNSYAGVLLALGKRNDRHPTLRGVDIDLAFLIRALDNPRQEVRDVAAYTIGLLGPAAGAATPFLESKWSDETLKGGWFQPALQSVSCQLIVDPGFQRVIPDRILARSSRGRMVALVASLYMDGEVEYPASTLASAVEFDAAAIARSASILRPIIANTGLSPEKRIEALGILVIGDKEVLEPFLPELLRLANSSDPYIRDLTVDAFVKLGDERAIPGLISRIRDDDWAAYWKKDICAFGPAAIAAENRLMALAATDDWLRAGYEAIDTLGCIHSEASIPQLTRNLAGLDWQRAERSALALGAIGIRSPNVLEALRSLKETHWSERVRGSARKALVSLGAETPPANSDAVISDDSEVIYIGGHAPVDHGLPWCDNASRYSIDGRNWFAVTWIQPTLQQVPRKFPKTGLMIQRIGTQTFLRVDDGWIFGSNGFESEGVFAHVSDDGIVTEWEGWRAVPFGHASIEGMLALGSRYFAYGYQVLKVGDPGVLFEITRSMESGWSARRVAILPGAPLAHAISPDGELLLHDGPSSYAVVEGRIVPLKCEKVFEGSYFDRH